MTYTAEKRKYATETLYIGYATMGTGAALGVAALAAVSDSEAKIGLGIVARVVAGGRRGLRWRRAGRLAPVTNLRRVTVRYRAGAL